MKYNILAKFFVPRVHREEVLRDSLVSGVPYDGVYLMSNTDTCQYAVVYEDWASVTPIGEDITTVDEATMDDHDVTYHHSHSDALIEFQSAMSTLVYEMHITHDRKVTKM